MDGGSAHAGESCVRRDRYAVTPMSYPAPVTADRRYRRLAWAALWFTVAVILGGAVVRATGSGAGCGESWPRCDGQIIPMSLTAERLVEFTHRIMTALLAVVLGAMAIWTLRATRRGDPVRRALGWSAFFFMGEVVIGAALVLFGWVDDDASIGRLIVVPLHLVNTFLLIGSLAVTAHFASGGRPIRVDLRRLADRILLAGATIMLVIAASGGLNALADTLFPADTLLEGLRQEFGSTAPFLVRLRTLHPVIAIGGGLAILMMMRHPSLADPAGLGLRRLVTGVVVAQFAIGLINVVLLTPLEIQIIHLLVADLLWIAFVLLAARLMQEPARAPAEVGR